VTRQRGRDESGKPTLYIVAMEGTRTRLRTRMPFATYAQAYDVIERIGLEDARVLMRLAFSLQAAFAQHLPDWPDAAARWWDRVAQLMAFPPPGVELRGDDRLLFMLYGLARAKMFDYATAATVFTDVTGKPMSARAMKKRLYKLVKKYDLAPIALRPSRRKGAPEVAAEVAETPN
jgi:hypothetical protein